jgi:bifunctional DNA-binding transcriptional regulator/antitoxin component of YhaV-PrlF toxin-antitoxin module
MSVRAHDGTMKTVTVNDQGRLTLPIESRRALGITGETEMQVEVDAERDVLLLRPIIVLRREDAWAYTPEHRSLLDRAHADSREGRVRSLDEDELATLGR